jgi:hypothetical protein
MMATRRSLAILALAFALLVASSAWAAEYGYHENLRYWHVNLFVSPIGQYQSPVDEFGHHENFLLAGGVALNRIADFSFALLGEYAAAFTNTLQQGRAELRFGYRYFTVGPTFSFTSEESDFVTIGPAASFDYPIYLGGGDANSLLLGVFYRLDAPTDGSHTLRQQVGLRLGYSNELFLAPFNMPSLRRTPVPEPRF